MHRAQAFQPCWSARPFVFSGICARRNHCAAAPSIGRSEKTCGADASEDRMSKAQLAWRLAAFVKARA